MSGTIDVPRLRAIVREALNDARSSRALLGDRAALGATRLDVTIERLERLADLLDQEAER